MPQRKDGLCRNGLHSAERDSVRAHGQMRCVPCRNSREEQRKANPENVGLWGIPTPDPEREARFAAFAAGIGPAIKEMRRREGIDSSKGDRWHTLGSGPGEREADGRRANMRGEGY